MLIEFRLKNHLSFKREASLLLTANSRASDDSRTFDTGITNFPYLLNSVAIYGANASGKSNLVKSLDMMRFLVLHSSSKIEKEQEIPFIPYLLEGGNQREPVLMEVVFIEEGVRYEYGFTANRNEIIEEWLYAYPMGKRQIWFKRSFSDYKFGAKFTGPKNTWKDATRKNALFISTAVQLNSEMLEPVYMWFKNKLHVLNARSTYHHLGTLTYSKNSERKKRILDALKSADTGIADFEWREGDEENIENDDEDKNKKLPKIDLTFVHKCEDGVMTGFLPFMESDGTLKVFELLGPLFRIFDKGDVLVIDELSNNLHPHLLRFIVEMFHNKEINKKNAQLIFTSHDATLLNQDFLRRDQIWFVEKGNEGSMLYPLTDFNPRVGEAIEKGYLRGKYGAIPNLQTFFMEN